MKVRVLLDPQGNPVAIERPNRTGSPAASDGEWRARVMEPEGHKFHDLELPDEFEKIDSADEFHTRLKPHLAKIKR